MRRLLAPALLLFVVGCYESHAPWSSAGPDDTAVSLELTLGRTGGPPYEARVIVTPEGDYVAADRYDLRICEGRLAPEQLADAERLVRETHGFELEGNIGSTWADTGTVSVTLRSEGGESTSFGGPLPDATLERYRAFADEILAEIDFAECPPHVLDPRHTELRVRFELYPHLTPSALEELAVDPQVTFELAAGESALVLREWTSGGAPLCEAPLTEAEREALLEQVRLAATDVDPDGFPTLDDPNDLNAFLEVHTLVPLPGREAMPRELWFPLQDERVGHEALEATLIDRLVERCR